MKKYIFLSLILITSIATSNAKQRTRYEILKSAQAVLSQHTGNRAMSQAESPLDIIKSNSQLTIVGDKNGFAVVANDDSFPAILGYSDTQFDGGQVAPGFQWWMDAITEQLEYNLEHGLQLTTATPSAGKHKDNVSALMVTQWGQNAPYNNQTPTYTSGKNEVHYVTGCVATAMAQIMYYHKWPERGKGNVSYYFTPEGSDAKQKLSSNLAKEPYDWNNMLPIYKGVNYSEEQAKAVSTLMMHCGYAVNMQYTKTGSGAFTADAADALRKRFYYNENMRLYWRDYFPDEEWMQIIFTELSEGNPVLYGAQRKDGGHEFVLDGYDADGKVHVNWGWDGGQNGFFDIASLNGYTTGQEMVLVRKDDAVIPYQSYWGMNGNISITLVGTTLKSSFLAYNLDYNAFSGKIAFLAMNLKNSAVIELETSSYDNVEPLKGANFSFTGNTTVLSDGNYRLYAGTLSSLEETWQPIRCNESYNNSYLLTITEGKASLKKEENANWTDIQGLRFENNSSIRYFDLQGRELGNDARGMVIMKQGNEVKKVIVR